MTRSDYQPGDDSVEDLPTSAAAATELRSYVERIESIETEVKDRNGDKSEIYKEAKAKGFDTKALKKLIAERRIDPDDLSELETILDLYRKAVEK